MKGKWASCWHSIILVPLILDIIRGYLEGLSLRPRFKSIFRLSLVLIEDPLVMVVLHELLRMERRLGRLKSDNFVVSLGTLIFDCVRGHSRPFLWHGRLVMLKHSLEVIVVYESVKLIWPLLLQVVQNLRLT